MIFKDTDEEISILCPVGDRGVTIQINEFTGGADVEIQNSADKGVTFEIVKIGGADLVLNASNTEVSLKGGGYYRIFRAASPANGIKLAVYSV